MIFLGLKVRFLNTRTWRNFGNRKQHFYGIVKNMMQKYQYIFDEATTMSLRGPVPTLTCEAVRPSLMGRDGMDGR